MERKTREPIRLELTSEELTTVCTGMELGMSRITKWINNPQWYTSVEGCKQKLREIAELHDKLKDALDSHTYSFDI